MPDTLPGLIVIKPDACELVQRVYSPATGRYAMSFGVLMPFMLRAPGQTAEPPFTSIWEHAAQILGKDDILDEGWAKPAGELLAAGHCHVPTGHTAQPVSAYISAGPLSKRLAIFGKRHATALGGISAPQAFERMPIRHTHAFGGPGHEYNPEGKGMPAADGTLELPNIELPDHLIASAADRPPVAGFGPLPAVWPQRARHLGKQDTHWRNTRWPHLPEDTNLRYFMAAPTDQHLPGFWQGGEAVLVRNMHPEFPELSGQLPKKQARFFVHQSDPDGEVRFRELNVHIDTVWLLPEACLGIAIYRSSIAVHDPDGRDINAFHAALEDPGLAPLPVEAYLNSCLKAMSPELFSDIPDNVSPEFRQGLSALNEAELLEKVREQREYFEASLREAGVDETELLNRLEANPHTRQFAQYIRQRNKSLSGFFNEIEGLFKLLDDNAVSAAAASGIPPDADFRLKQALPRAPLPGEHAARNPAPDTSTQALHDAGAAAQNRQRVMNAMANGHSCANLDLSHANLAGLDLGGMDFTGALLAGANLAGAQLQGAAMQGVYAAGARFDAANMAGCQLSGATLGNASFTGTLLRGANLDTSDCTSANFAGADLSSASFKGATLSFAWLQGIRAERLMAPDARLDHANLDQAQLPNALLDGATLAGASAQRINLEEASANRIDFSQADLSGANLRKAQLAHSQAGPGTSLEKACLDQANLENASWMSANLQEASMQNLAAQQADFSDTRLSSARLQRADLRQASFDRARLESADLSAANLMQASFIHSNLQHCNFEHSNLYNATFKDPQLAGARFNHANLDLTVLAVQ